MKSTFTLGTLNKEDFSFYEKNNPGYTCTGETLTERFPDYKGIAQGSQTLVIFKCKPGKHGTAYGMCRDCGDHYIIARWSRYDRIDKDTLMITYDVEDR